MKTKKYENGGKTKKKSGQSYVYAGPGKAKKDMPFVRGRSEGFPLFDKERPASTTSGIPGVGRPMTTRQGAPDKMKPIGPKRINNDEGMKSMVSAPKNPQRSTATIPVPAKKKRRLLRRK